MHALVFAMVVRCLEASGSFDKGIFLWNVYGECENYGVMRGHVNAVLEVPPFDAHDSR